MKQKNYVIGIDGGGTKTMVAIANLEGKVLKVAKVGPSSPRNIKTKTAVDNIERGIKKVLKRGNILSTFIGLAAIQEQPRLKRKIKKEISKRKEFLPILKGKLKIGSDQVVAFRSGTNEKEGVLIIAGTGCVAHGWRKGKEYTASGSGWLNDEGSAFWVGQRAFQAIIKDLDKRGPKTLMTPLVFDGLKIKNTQQFLGKVYSKDFVKIIPLLSVFADEASKKGDRVAKEILKEAAKELALAAKIVIRKLGFQKKEFPLVLVGGMFKSKIILKEVKREIKNMAISVKFIRPRKEPVTGAIRLAQEAIEKRSV